MLFGRYIKWFSMFFTTLLVSEQIPLIKTIDASPSEASQLFSTVSAFAGEVKDNIVEMVARPSYFFHDSEHNQSSPDPPFSPLPVEPPLESPPEPPQPPETSPAVNSTSRFWRKEESKVIVEFDLGWIPKVGVLWKVFGWVAHSSGVLFPSGSGVDSTGHSYWLYVVVPAVLGFFGGFGYGLAGWCRRRLSRKSPELVEKVESAVIVKEKEQRAPANVYLESRLSQSYMMPSNFRHALGPSRLKLPASVASKMLGDAEGANPTIDMIAKKEEDADPLTVPSSLSESSWYSPGSTLLPTQLNGNGLGPSYDGFQPRPRVSHPSDLPDTLLGSFPSVSSPPPPPKPKLPNISDPWNDYFPDETNFS